MKLVFITNFVNHHQIPVADELYKVLKEDYKYIATMPLPEWLVKNGYDANTRRPYIVNDFESEETHQNAMRLAIEADVAIIGSAPDSFIEERMKQNKVTFRYSERLFKNRPWYFPDPRVLKNIYLKHFRYRKKRLYMLAASAYTANDVYHMYCYKDKIYKWGYFTQVDNFALDTCQKLKPSCSEKVSHIMWCARFLQLKHPELPIKLAHRLKIKGYKFHLDMFGSGEELDNTKRLAEQLNVKELVSFCGNMPNFQIIRQMREHEIFLFTSDKREGWGAVLNESMSNGCAVVASHDIGAAPFLIKDEINGLLFKSEDIDSLEQKVTYLLDHPQKRIDIARNAIMSMRNEWSPQNAAQRLLFLSNRILSGYNDVAFTDGPCSKAYPYSTK